MKFNQAIALMYHDIVTSKRGMHVYDVALDAFKEQIELIKVLRSHTDSAPGVYNLISNKEVMLTFDDGYRIWAEQVMDVMFKAGLRGFFFVCIRNINDASILKHHVKALHDNGMIIGSHAMTHRFLHTLSSQKIFGELSESKKILEEITGDAVRYFSIPRGVCTKQILDIAQRVGYRHVFISQIGINQGYELTVKRIPVMRNTNIEKYKSILNGEGIERMAHVQLLKDKAKGMLGIELYNRVRRILLPGGEKKKRTLYVKH